MKHQDSPYNAQYCYYSVHGWQIPLPRLLANQWFAQKQYNYERVQKYYNS